MTKILIPVGKLEEGFYDCVRHIEDLIAASEILYDKRSYSNALPLAILAIEDISKLGVIKDHILSNQPITKEEWDALTGPRSHRLKLRMRLERDIKMLKGFTPEKYEAMRRYNEQRGIKSTLPYETMQNDDPRAYDMALLDTLKQDCFYLGWKNDWWTFDIGLTAEEQEAIVWLIIRQAKNWMLISILGKRYPKATTDYDQDLVGHDPEMKRWMVLNSEFGTPEHRQRVEISREVIKRYPR